MVHRHVIGISAAILFCLLPAIGMAGPFSAAISVNGATISKFDIDQRIKMLRALGQSGDVTGRAEDALVNERLFLQEAKRLGVTVATGEIDSGLGEYADRSDMTAEQFIRQMGSRGVVRETLYEFIRAGVAWRTVVKARYSDAALGIGDDEIDQALVLRGTARSEQLLLSEVVLQFRPATRERTLAIADTIVNTIRTTSEFAEAARSLSAAESRDNGGDIGWIPVSGLDNEIRERLRRAPNGSTVGPIVSENLVYVFFKRATRDVEIQQTRSPANDYVTLRVYGDSRITARDLATRITGRVDACNDLLAESRRFQKGSYVRRTTSPQDTLEDLKAPLAGLDAGETTILGTGGGGVDTVVLLMLCDRKTNLDPEDRQFILQRLRNQKLETLAQNLLSNLRASAIIKRQ